MSKLPRDNTGPRSDSQTGSLQQALEQARLLLRARNYKAALAQSKEIQKQFPNDPQAAWVGCVALRHLGEPMQVRKILERLLGRLGDVAPLLFEFGLALRATGEMHKSIELFERCVAADPNHARGWQALGEQLADRGDFEAADEAFRQQMASSSVHPGLAKAVEYVAQGKLGMAEGICRDYLYRYPLDVNAIRLLADIGLQLEIHEDAAKLLKRCVELAPDYHLARNNYATALSRGNRFTEALEQLDLLEAAEPQNLSHPVLAASVYVNVGDYDAAIERYERVLERAPQHALLQMSYGHALKTVGRREESEAAYRRAIAAEPTLGEAYWSLANLKTFRFTDAEIAAMRVLLKKPTSTVEKLAGRDEFHLSFALGKALEDSSDYAESFEWYSHGNALKRAGSSYSAADNTQQTDALIESCLAEKFAERAGYGSQANDPIFIVGLPRSGSTLLEQILASHSQVDGTMELPIILQLVRRLANRKNKGDPSHYPEALWSLSPSQCVELGEEFLAGSRVQRQGAPLFIDKMPNNFAHVGLIQLILPNAKIIDARRHPYATCFSGFKQLFAAGQEFTYSLPDISAYYRDYARLMAHWDSVLPGRVLRMNYEEVIGDFETQVRRLLSHCGLPFESQCLEFYANQRAVRTASSEQVRQPLYSGALEQWRHYERWIVPELEGVLKAQ